MGNGNGASTDDDDDATVIGLFSTEKKFAFYINSCPLHLRQAGLFDLFFLKFPTDLVLQNPIIQKVAKQARAVRSTSFTAESARATRKRAAFWKVPLFAKKLVKIAPATKAAVARAAVENESPSSQDEAYYGGSGSQMTSQMTRPPSTTLTTAFESVAQSDDPRVNREAMAASVPPSVPPMVRLESVEEASCTSCSSAASLHPPTANDAADHTTTPPP